MFQPGVRGIYSEHHLKTTEQALETIKTTAPDLSSMMRMVTSKVELEKLRLPTALAAVVTDVAARMWPYKFVCRILEDLLTSSDLDGLFNLQTLTPVTTIRPDDRGVDVHTARGTIRASRVVLATNAYTSHLVPSFSDLIVPCRGQMSSLVPFPSVAGGKRLKTSFGFLGDGLDDYLIQRPSDRGEHLMFGGGRQHGPSIGVTDDSVVDSKTAHYLRSRLIEVFQLPESEDGASQTYEMEATHEWSGIMGFSRNGLPWVGKVPETTNTFISAGFTGHGMPNTWLCGKAVALLVSGSLNQKCSDTESLHKVKQETGLPDSYLASEERIKSALQIEDVEAQDWSEMKRGQGQYDAEYQTQLELLEQHCRSRLRLAQKESQAPEGSRTNPGSGVRISSSNTQFCGQTGSADGNDALEDYQFHLDMLESQNKKRLLMAREEQAYMSPLNAQISTPPKPSTQAQRSETDGNNALEGYKNQMQLLERQTGRRSLMASPEQETHVSLQAQVQNIAQPQTGFASEDPQSQIEGVFAVEVEGSADPEKVRPLLVKKNEHGKFEIPYIIKRQMQVLEEQRRLRASMCGLSLESPSTLQRIESQVEKLNLLPNAGSYYVIDWAPPRPTHSELVAYHQQLQALEKQNGIRRLPTVGSQGAARDNGAQPEQ